MRVYASMDPRLPLAEVGGYGRRIEQLGFDGLHVAETVHDGLIVSALALEHTERIVVRTAVTVAFARSPMTIAYAAWGLAGSFAGRFELGLGTQVRGNLEGRFGVAWADPVARMRDYVEALRAIFEAFASEGALHHEGAHYSFTRLQPYFTPGAHDQRDVRILLGGVNEKMCRLAGEVADGFITHPTNSHPRYLRDVCIPNLRAGATHAVRARPEVIVSGPVITGASTDAVAASREHQRRMLGFVYSTPAYRKTLELLGHPDVATRLHELAREERWDEMPGVVSDELLDALVPQGTYAELPSLLRGWFGDLASGLVLRPPEEPGDDDRFAETVARLRAPD